MSELWELFPNGDAVHITGSLATGEWFAVVVALGVSVFDAGWRRRKNLNEARLRFLDRLLSNAEVGVWEFFGRWVLEIAGRTPTKRGAHSA